MFDLDRISPTLYWAENDTVCDRSKIKKRKGGGVTKCLADKPNYSTEFGYLNFIFCFCTVCYESTLWAGMSFSQLGQENKEHKKWLYCYYCVSYKQIVSLLANSWHHTCPIGESPLSVLIFDSSNNCTNLSVLYWIPHPSFPTRHL